MKICPFCNKKINLNFDTCPHCENNLKVYRLYKNFSWILYALPSFFCVIYYEEFKKIILKFNINTELLVLFVILFLWSRLINYIEKRLFLLRK